MLLAIRLPSVSTTSWSPLVLPHFGYFQNLTSFANNSLCNRISSLRPSSMVTSVFCDQHDPETRLPSHHIRVRSRCLFERDGFDHGRHTTQRTETKRGITGRRVSGQ